MLSLNYGHVLLHRMEDRKPQEYYSTLIDSGRPCWQSIKSETIPPQLNIIHPLVNERYKIGLSLGF